MLRRAQELLQNLFGYDNFRDQQAHIIEHLTVLERDALVLMPTGGGKSLCFQIPALLRDGLAVVISPLIALMDDQVAALHELGISAAALNSTLTEQQQKDIIKRIELNQIKILYLAPERLMQKKMLYFLSLHKLALFAIDEAHCVVQWGHDFRPEYLKLGQLTNLFPAVPKVALTAAADAKTSQEIVQRLQLNNTKVFSSSFDRPNIIYRVVLKENIQKQLLNFLKAHKNEAGIIYCASRSKVEAITGFLLKHGLSAFSYHAGLPYEERARNQNKFFYEEGVVIVATVAFGMGINKSNVRFVAHLDVPKSLEAYYQETGRAGRDGLTAEAWMLYGLIDVLRLKQQLNQFNAHADHWIAEDQKISSMLGYCEQSLCRRQTLLSYFGEELIKPCGHCDNCLQKVITWDATQSAQKVLSAIYRSGQMYAAGHIVDLLRGRDSKNVKNLGHQKLSVFGIGSDTGEWEWRCIIRQLIASGWIDVRVEPYNSLVLSKLCRPLLRSEIVLQLRKDKKTSADLYQNRTLWDELRQLRSQLAQANNIPPYVVFTDATLLDMLQKKPLTLKEMGSIYGVGVRKLACYGDVFLEVIQGKSSKISYDLTDSIIHLIRLKLAPSQIANQLNCSEKTVYLVMTRAITQKQISLSNAIDLSAELLDELYSLFLSSEEELASVSDVAKQLKKPVHVSILRCVRAGIQVELATD
ncbi:UNVERIFIED_CONTAM: hypothetical protein GTU68_041664 [Idotea baltica]|nr:hypothetical protein [Idotea baltica]